MGLLPNIGYPQTDYASRCTSLFKQAVSEYDRLLDEVMHMLES